MNSQGINSHLSDSRLRHLKKLSSVKGDKNIKFLTPAVYSGGWCPMRAACNIVEGIEGLSYMLVGMPECATHSRGMTSMPEGPGGEARLLYVLDANEVIFGCREGVIEALLRLDKEGIRALLMIATCVTDLIGEDFEAIISEVQPKIKMKLSYVTLGQFKNFAAPIGTSKVAEALATLMEPPQESEISDDKQVNALFIEPWRNKNTPTEFPLIVDALKQRGVSVRALTGDSPLDNYLLAPNAVCNLVLSDYTLSLAKKIEKNFSVKRIDLHSAFSVEEIDLTYLTLSKMLDISLEGAFDEWRTRAVELEKRAEIELRGLKYVMLTSVDMPLALARYLGRFGMEPILIHMLDFLPGDEENRAALNEMGYDPPICRIMHQDHDIELIRTLCPDICFGYIKEEIPGLKVSREMGDFFGLTGYERTAGILSRLFSVLETGITPQGGFDIHGSAPL
ncbi:MAG: nitrogen fixation protein NifE [Eubacteriaceae bacterium]|nr:nitrogen fixation protein NifE [Eubacteriaceae bacterium]